MPNPRRNMDLREAGGIGRYGRFAEEYGERFSFDAFGRTKVKLYLERVCEMKPGLGRTSERGKNYRKKRKNRNRAQIFLISKFSPVIYGYEVTLRTGKVVCLFVSMAQKFGLSHGGLKTG
uniref:Uncharacterized protein n=1 Tax=Rhodnius prolixus TaxID=13249 RepID=T1HNP1_RHOPR